MNTALSLAKGENALAGASSAVTAEAVGMISQAYYGKNADALSEEQKQKVSALASLAAGLAGGLVGGNTESAVSGMQTGKVTVENNFLAVIAQGGKLAVQGCVKVAACRNKLIESGLGALIGATAATSAVEQLSSAQKTNVMLAAMSGDPALVDKLSPAERKAYDELRGQKGLITGFPVPEKDPTGGKLVNLVQEQNKGTSLVTPDQRDQSGTSHTGNASSAPDTGGNTTVTPIPEGPNKDDLAYQSEGSRPENMSPDGAGRSGAFNEAKRQSGVPVGKNPDRVLPNVDKRGNPQPGKIYEFDVPKPGGGTQTIQIRDDAKGHFFGEKDIQNRGPHFNDQEGNHYDY